MNPKLQEKIRESLASVLPITAIVLLISIFLVPVELGTFVMFICGAIFLVLGMGFFQLGAEMAMNPLGEGFGVQIAKSKHLFTILCISFFMGALITVAEPDLQVLAQQVPAIENSILILTVAGGVGIFLTLAILRILWKLDLSILLMFCYGILILFSFFVPKDFLAVAFDSGGVTTGPLTVPFIMAMGMGLTLVRSDKDASADSFGLVALSSIGPILAVLILGLFFNTENTSYTSSEMIQVFTSQDVVREFVLKIPHYAKEVLISLLPLLAVFFLFQQWCKRYKKRQQKRILVGFLYTFIGLVLFLCGVNIGFAPLGTLLGQSLAKQGVDLLVPLGMVIGYFIVKAEPAIQILNHQIQAVTNGAVHEKAMNRCLSIGVAVSIGLSMLRIILRIPIQWILLPGYLLALILSRLVPKMFVGIAFDSGGVASGPMTTTFLLPLCIGACEALGGNIMSEAFGVVALVALTPLIAVQIMGLYYKWQLTKIDKSKANILPEDIDEIIEFEEV